MSNGVRIENLHIENVFVVPDAAPEGAEHGIFAFLKEQMAAGADPKIMGETGYPVADEVTEPAPDDIPTPEEQAELDQERADRLAERIITDEMIMADARSDALHQLVKELDGASSKRGFQVTDERHPNEPKKIAKIRTEKRLKAESMLAKACGRCIFQGKCKLEENLPLWHDVHPYKDRDAARPGSTYVRKRESRLDFIEAVRKDPQAHCDPAKRK